MSRPRRAHTNRMEWYDLQHILCSVSVDSLWIGLRMRKRQKMEWLNQPGIIRTDWLKANNDPIWRHGAVNAICYDPATDKLTQVQVLTVN